MVKTALLMIVLISLVLIVPCEVEANNQDLTWGVSVDDRFDFDFTGYELSITSIIGEKITESLYVTVDEIHQIPDDITLLSQIPMVNTTPFYTNGTEITSLDTLLQLAFVMPIGNWTLIRELWNASAPDTLEWTETNYTIGFSISSFSQTFWKADGVVFEYSLNLGLGLEWSLKRTDVTIPDTNVDFGALFPPMDDYQIALVAIGAIGFVAVLAFVLMRNKSG